MRAEIHGPDGRHIILDVKGDDLGALVDHAEVLYRLIDGPTAAPIGFSAPSERAAEPVDADEADPTRATHWRPQ